MIGRVELDEGLDDVLQSLFLALQLLAASKKFGDVGAGRETALALALQQDDVSAGAAAHGISERVHHVGRLSNRIQVRPPFASKADPLRGANASALTKPRPASRSLT